MDTFGPDERRTAQITACWRDDRRYLHAVALRIVADAGTADDVVAEAFTRLAAQPEDVRDARGWLIVVVRRLALDRRRSGHARWSVAVDPAEPSLDRALRRTGPPDRSFADPVADPADRVTLDDDIRRSLAAVLDWLTPGERAAFLLHDVFGLPFADIAILVGRPDTACRKLASRARRAIRGAGPGLPRATADHAGLESLTERFIAACSNGDIDGLAALLHRDVSGWAMGGGRVLSEVHGVDQVCARAVAFFGPRSPWGMAPFPLDDGPGVLVTHTGVVKAMIRLRVVDGLVTDLRATVLDR